MINIVQCRLGVLIFTKNSNFNGWRVGCHYTAKNKNFLQKKFFSSYHIAIAQWPHIIQRKFCKIQRKTVKFCNFNFSNLKSLLAAFIFRSLYFWGHEASFDTHIVIYTLMSHVATPSIILCHNCQIWHIKVKVCHKQAQNLCIAA